MEDIYLDMETVNPEEMTFLVYKYMRTYNVPEHEAERMVNRNGFSAKTITTKK